MIKIKEKKASLETKEIIELILGAAVIFLLVLLLYQLIAPGLDKDKEAAKSYFDAFKTTISSVDKTQTGEFSIWQDDKTWLVYFANKNSFGFSESNWGKLYSSNEDGTKRHLFLTDKSYQNLVCICYDVFDGNTRQITEDYHWDGNNNDFTKTKCDYCMSLDLKPVYFKQEAVNQYGQFAIGLRDGRVQITKDKDNYLFLSQLK